MTRRFRRLPLVAACLFALLPVFVTAGADKKAAPAKNEQYKGKVVPLADVLGKAGAPLDADAAPYWLALVSEDGTIYPLVKDSGSRLFFTDREVLNRPMQLTGRLVPKSQLLQVTAVRSIIKERLHEIYYWCEICSIRRSEKNSCECCGGPMLRREEPVKK